MSDNVQYTREVLHSQYQFARDKLYTYSKLKARKQRLFTNKICGLALAEGSLMIKTVHVYLFQEIECKYY